jgi:hypothetical protein
MSELNEPVNHPAHYTDGKYEVIDFIEDQGFGFHLGNAVKYISRCGKKDPKKEVEDLQKAKWYISRAVDNASNFNSYPKFKINRKEYCQDKGLAPNLTKAVLCICDGSYTMAMQYIDLYIAEREETQC